MCKFFRFIISSVSHYVQVPYLFTFHQIFSVPLCASSPYFYISLYLQCPILGKFPIYLHSIRSSVSHSGQVTNNFVLHYIFSVPLCASSLSFYLSLFPLCTIMCKFSFFLPFIICSVSHYVQVLHLFTFHYIFSVPFWASSLSIYIPLDLQCPIVGKYPIILCFIIYLVSHYVQVPYLFTFHYFLCVPLCASSPSFYISLYLQCPILGKFPIYLHSIRSSVSHFGQVPYLFTFHYIFSVPFGASSLSIYIPLDLQCPIMCMFPIFLPFIISLVSHLCKFPNFLCFVISSVSHSGQVPYSFTFHYIFSVPLCASSPYFYISFYIQCPILCKFPNFLCFVISSVSHCGQVPNNFVLHYIFSVPLCASSLSIYISLSSVSHYVQVLHFFPFHYIFSVPFWASSLSIYIPLDLQCPILGKFPIYLHFIISLVSHLGQVPYLFTFHQIFSVPLWASSLSFYLSLYLQFPIMCKFPNFLCFVISSVSHSGQVPYSLYVSHSLYFYISVSHYVQVPYSYLLQCPILGIPNNFVLHYIFSVPLCASSLSFYLSLYVCVPLCASSPSFYISLYIQCPIMCKFPIYLHFIRSSVSHYVQVPYLFTFHYIFSVPFGASTLSSFTFHYIFSVPLCASSPIFLPFIIYFSFPFCASSLTSYVSLYLQCPIVGKYPIILCFIIYLVSHYVQVPYLFTFHQIFSVPLCASSPFFSISLYLQCPILGKFPIYLHSIISLVSHFGQVPYLFTFHYIFSVPFGASSLSIYIPLDLQCPIMCKFPIFLPFIISLVSHHVQVP